MRKVALIITLCARFASAQDLFIPSAQANLAGDVAGSLAGEDLQAPRQPPHILFLLSDDLGWNNVGFHNPLVHTPNIDALRAQGIELSRHYAYKFCSPSRSSFLSGRLPVHVNERNRITEAPLAGVHPNMTMIPAVLKRAGYKTHHIGKWHAGYASRSGNLPINRGFDSSLAYFHGAEDHWTQSDNGNVDCGQKFTDFWLDHGPAIGLNGTDYSMHIYRDRAVKIIKEHDPATPLFLYLAFANNHKPLQVPEKYMESYSMAEVRIWRVYNAMITAVDTVVGEIVGLLHAKGMWENSLVIWTSDNGGPHCPDGGNNYPHRGGKLSNWEGGFRVPTAVSGGIVPAERRGSTYAGITHFADWWATFAALAGHPIEDAAAEAAGLPAIDGQDLRDALFRGSPSPWTQKPLFLSSHAADPTLNPLGSSVLVLDDYKILTGVSVQNAWSGQHSPNASNPTGACTPHDRFVHCGSGCLYNVVADPGEHVNLARSEPGKLAELRGILHQMAPGVYNPPRGDPGLAPCAAAVSAGGYWAPYLP